MLCAIAECMRDVTFRETRARALSKFYGQANRAISTRQLKELPLVHFEPIKQVVFLRPLHP
jgi:hypothetical protein